MEDFTQTKRANCSLDSIMTEEKDCEAGVVYHLIYEKGVSPGAKSG